ncbi:prolyl-tRNA synthetase associated domain-containing protein [Streptomyces bambusae]|uniref:prolyl-tRNA synthetase associated domain-containing protein n=1 Tax=Streptomyces bambusae TaxID=1550616 RepID=UPI001CFC4DF5|nr:prolyl-tRNA synthetase associated domain-containing protein [Streptomyces bambusae]MCB5167388.1 prolyl-tRNA synthetase associated domain-containing protein [Streptomyces bambusae]
MTMRDADQAEAALTSQLDELGIAWASERHPPVFTVEEAGSVVTHLGGAGTKNLFLRDRRKQYLLLVADEDTSVDLKLLAAACGVGRLSFARPEALADVLGVTPGAVSPFALMNAAPGSVRVVLDARLTAHELLLFHPLRNDATTAVSPEGILTFLRACGHEPEVRALDR